MNWSEQISCARSRLCEKMPLIRFEHSTGARAALYMEANCFPLRPRRTCSRGLKQHTGDMILGHIIGRGSCIVKACDGFADGETRQYGTTTEGMPPHGGFKNGRLDWLGQWYLLEFLSLDLSQTNISHGQETWQDMIWTQVFWTILHFCTSLMYRVILENIVRGDYRMRFILFC